MSATAFNFATRLNSFRNRADARLSVREAIAAVSQVPGLSAIELNYPQHFAGEAPETVVGWARDAGLAITALNLRYDGPQFTSGAFTHPVASNRAEAIRISCDAVDVAAGHGIGHVILWMGPDGFDVPFQADYAALWAAEIEGFRQVAAHNPEVRVSVEYKPSDPRRISLIRSMADSLLAASEVGLPNFGVTLDFCHVLMAGEHPAAVASMALRAGRLFGVHLNDGYGPADDGLPVGAVHPWHTLELLMELRKAGFAGTLYFDTFPDRVDPAEECAANIATVQRLLAIADRIPREQLRALQASQDALGATKLVQGLAFNG